MSESVWVWATAKDCDLICDPNAAEGVCVEVCGSCYHRGPCGHLKSGPLPVIKLISKGFDSTGALTIQNSCTPTQDHAGIRLRLLPGAMPGAVALLSWAQS